MIFSWLVLLSNSVTSRISYEFPLEQRALALPGSLRWDASGRYLGYVRMLPLSLFSKDEAMPSRMRPGRADYRPGSYIYDSYTGKTKRVSDGIATLAQSSVIILYPFQRSIWFAVEKVNGQVLRRIEISKHVPLRAWGVSPNGRSAVFCVQEPADSGHYELGIVDLVTRKSIVIPLNGEPSGEVLWSPDSAEIWLPLVRQGNMQNSPPMIAHAGVSLTSVQILDAYGLGGFLANSGGSALARDIKSGRWVKISPEEQDSRPININSSVDLFPGPRDNYLLAISNRSLMLASWRGGKIRLGTLITLLPHKALGAAMNVQGTCVGWVDSVGRVQVRRLSRMKFSMSQTRSSD